MFHTVVCPDGWHRHNVSCFYVSDDKENQQTARDNCQELDADLASISSQEEMNFVASIT